MTSVFWICLIEGDSATMTLDIEGSPVVQVIGTSDSRGCEDLMNQFVYEVGHVSWTCICNINVSIFNGSSTETPQLIKYTSVN